MQPDHKGQSQLSKAVLAKIHIAAKALGLDEDDYRDVLERVTGCRSARDISPEQVPALQRALRDIGWDGYLLTKEEYAAVGAHGMRPGPLKYEELGYRHGYPNPAQLRKLDALFNTTPGYGTVDGKAALRAFLKKRFGCEDIRFLTLFQFEKCLKAVREIRARLGMTDEG